MNNSRLLVALVAAFVAGAIVFAPFRSFARSADDSSSNGQMLIRPGTDQLIVKEGKHIAIYRIDAIGRSGKLTFQDSATMP